VGITAALAGLGRANLGAKKYADAEHHLRQAAQNYKTMNSKTRRQMPWNF